MTRSSETLCPTQCQTANWIRTFNSADRADKIWWFSLPSAESKVRILLLTMVTVCVIATPSLGQEQSWIQARLGAGISEQEMAYSWAGIVPTNPVSSWVGGLSLDIPLWQYRAMVEASYSRMGTTLDYGSFVGGNTERTYTTDQLSLTAAIRFLASESSLRPYAVAGPRLDILLDTDIPEFSEEILEQGFTNQRSLGLGFDLGFGIEKAISSNGRRVFAEIRYSHSILDSYAANGIPTVSELFPPPSGWPEFQSFKINNQRVSVTVGIDIVRIGHR